MHMLVRDAHCGLCAVRYRHMLLCSLQWRLAGLLRVRLLRVRTRGRSTHWRRWNRQLVLPFSSGCFSVLQTGCWCSLVLVLVLASKQPHHRDVAMQSRLHSAAANTVGLAL